MRQPENVALSVFRLLFLCWRRVGGRQPEIQNEVAMARCQMVYSIGIYWLGKCWRAADAKVVLCGVLGFVAYSAHYWMISHRCFDYGFQAASKKGAGGSIVDGE